MREHSPNFGTQQAVVFRSKIESEARSLLAECRVCDSPRNSEHFVIMDYASQLINLRSERLLDERPTGVEALCKKIDVVGRVRGYYDHRFRYVKGAPLLTTKQTAGLGASLLHVAAIRDDFKVINSVLNLCDLPKENHRDIERIRDLCLAFLTHLSL